MDKLLGSVSRPLKSLWRRASLIRLRGEESTEDFNQPTVNATSGSIVGTKRQCDEEETYKVVSEDRTLSKRPGLETKTTDQEIAPVLGEMALDGPSAQETEYQNAPTSGTSKPSREKKKQRNLRGTRPEEQANGPPKLRLGSKKQCAMLVAFCGTGCSGMQM